MRGSLPDLLADRLDIVFIGINPACYSVDRGHYFARPTNRFWQCFSRSILSRAARDSLGTQRLLPEHDRALMQFGFGFTDLVKRPTIRADELAEAEFRKGIGVLTAKIDRYRPRIVCFQGIGGYRHVHRALGAPKDALDLGPQALRLRSAAIYLVPNPSGANAHVTPKQQTGWYDSLALFLSRIKTRPLLSYGRRRSIPDLPEGTGKQFIQGSYDCITFLGE